MTSDILNRLKALDEERGGDLERWFARARQETPPFIYTSVDLRHSGLRLVPVDTNLYPAGFNNLSPRARVRASRFLARFLADNYPDAERVLIIPENHTRNLAYLENLAALMDIFTAAGVDVQLGSLMAQAGQPMMLQTMSGRTLTEYPMFREGGMLRLEGGFTPDLVVMNNDMTAGTPTLLQGIAQPVMPPEAMGWWRRRKSVHFAAYRQLAHSFCAEMGLDPWLLCAGFYACGRVDFKERTGLDCVARGVEAVLSSVQEKYRAYGVSDDPYVFIKADSGTYGMGIMTVRSPEEVLELNKKNRNKMNIIKEGTRVSEVIIQEGVPTIDSVSGKVAEPMVYMIDGVPVGGMFRVNGQRDRYGNLNAAGMEFTGMCDEVEDELCSELQTVEECHFRAYGIVAVIAALAAVREDYAQGLSVQACR